MKNGLFLQRTFLIVILSFTFTIGSIRDLNAQASPSAGYYVIVAAYYSNGESYAEKYAGTFESGSYSFFPEKKMYMVHLSRYDDKGAAIQEMKKVRANGIKEDAWVYVYKPENIEVVTEPEPSKPEVSDIPEKPAESPEEPTEPPSEEITETEPVVTEDIPVEPEVAVEEPTSTEVTVDKPEVDPYEGMHPVFFKVHHGTSTEEVEGKIQVIDPAKGRIINSLEGNVWHHIDKPSNAHSEVQLVAELFGYRKVSHVIHLDDPSLDSTDYFVQVRNDSIIVDFEMVRYHVGDIFTMYNVYFFSHSAIMRPESVYELDQLLSMLNENLALKIILHGHTNGSSAGDMRYKPEGDHNLFSTSGAEEKTASAKVLSEERANVVRRYLLDKGVRADRMEIKGWGGKRMLYKKADPQAIKNVRVEIEIISE